MQIPVVSLPEEFSGGGASECILRSTPQVVCILRPEMHQFRVSGSERQESFLALSNNRLFSVFSQMLPGKLLGCLLSFGCCWGFWEPGWVGQRLEGWLALERLFPAPHGSPPVFCHCSVSTQWKNFYFLWNFCAVTGFDPWDWWIDKWFREHVTWWCQGEQEMPEQLGKVATVRQKRRWGPGEQF